MIKSLTVRSYSLAIPAIALTTIVLNGIFATQISTAIYWLITIAMLAVLLGWQRSLRSSYSESPDSEMNSAKIAAVRPYAITYGILYTGFLTGLVFVIYFGLGMPYVIACFAAWFIRREVWLALLLRGLNKSGERLPVST